MFKKKYSSVSIKSHCPRFISAEGHTVGQSAEKLELIEQECPLIVISDYMHLPTENRSHDSEKIKGKTYVYLYTHQNSFIENHQCYV